MKKLIAMLLVLVCVLTLAACAPADNTGNTTNTTTNNTENTTDDVKVMTYAEYAAAPVDSVVTVECYVQGAQGWWFNSDAGHGVITVYAQDENGGYFMYEMACEEADAAKLLTGKKIRVTGDKKVWDGEVEIMNATFTFVEDAKPFIAQPLNINDLVGKDELESYMNQLICVTGAVVSKVEYKNGEPGDDIYLTVTVGEAELNLCVEKYLTGTDSEVYKTVGALKEGDTVDVEGFLYWYNGANPHVTRISRAN